MHKNVMVSVSEQVWFSQTNPKSWKKKDENYYDLLNIFF